MKQQQKTPDSVTVIRVVVYTESLEEKKNRPLNQTQIENLFILLYTIMYKSHEKNRSKLETLIVNISIRIIIG